MKQVSSLFIKSISGILLVTSLFVSCRRQPVSDAQHENHALVGAWEKVTRPECGKVYPDVIEFNSNGVYQTQSEATAVTMAWDAGTYEVDRQIVKISNAQELSRTYRFVIKNEMVTFEDDQSCKFAYRRM